jgi:phosphatidylglycerophosphatase A
MTVSLPEKLLVTFFGTGFSPIAPATVASAAVCIVYWFLPFLTCWPFALLIVPFFFISVLLSQRAIGAFAIMNDEQFKNLRRPNPKTDDPDQVVIDEWIGQWIALCFLPHTLVAYTAAFVAFRIFDILKPLGINSLQKFKGGWGIVLDDVLAGVYSASVLLLVRIVSPSILGG